LIVLSALRHSDNENMLSLVILILREHKREVEIPDSSRTTIHNHMLIPYYQDFKIKTSATLIGNIKGKWRYLIPAEPKFITTCSYPTIKNSKSRLPLL
nr:hypothetical protein [Tanacetum cinerariifolium]